MQKDSQRFEERRRQRRLERVSRRAAAKRAGSSGNPAVDEHVQVATDSVGRDPEFHSKTVTTGAIAEVLSLPDAEQSFSDLAEHDAVPDKANGSAQIAETTARNSLGPDSVEEPGRLSAFETPKVSNSGNGTLSIRSDEIDATETSAMASAHESTADHEAAEVREKDQEARQTVTTSARQAPRSWTSEPVLLALVLVALFVLIVDSYFMIRLNGLSDRLSAIAAKPATVAPSAADRPWVGADSIKTVDFSSGGQPLTTLHIINTGRTPAMDLRSNTLGRLSSASTSPPNIPTQPGPLGTTGVLMPNTGGDMTFFANTRALTAEEAGTIKSGQNVLWLAGRLDYRDSQGRPHVTTFRYRYDPALNSFVATSTGNSVN